MRRRDTRATSSGNAVLGGITFRELCCLAYDGASVRIAANDIRHKAVHDIRAEWKRPPHVDDQHCAHLIAVIDHGMRPAIVEQDSFALLPDVVLRINDDLWRILFWHAKPKMITQVAQIGALVLRH